MMFKGSAIRINSVLSWFVYTSRAREQDGKP